MLTGYARTSTTDQTAGLEDQIVALTAAGCDILSEHVSGAKQRDELDEALRFAYLGARS